MNKSIDAKAKRTVKDTLFRHLFSYNKENALSLYNAVNGTSYTDTSQLVFVTLEDTIYINYKNDNAFLFEGFLNLYEHQSTINPNMPLRGFFYHARMYEGMLVNDEVLFRTKLYKIPTPRYVVFYNGVDYSEDIVKLRLSDAFERPDNSGEFEWTATVLNINVGHNEKIVKACETLHGYSTLIDKIRGYKQIYTNEKAVEFAIDDCIKAGILADYLTKCRNEAISMALTTFNQEKYEEYLKEDYMEMGYEKGVEEGIEKGIIAMAAMIKEGKVNLSDAALLLDVSQERISRYLD